MVARTAEWRMEMSLVLAILFLASDRWVPGGLLSCTNWIMWRRNKLSSSIHATDYPQRGRRRGGESRQRQKEGWLVMMALRRNPAQRKCLQIGWLTSLLLSAAPGDKCTGHTNYLPSFSAGTG